MVSSSLKMFLYSCSHVLLPGIEYMRWYYCFKSVPGVGTREFWGVAMWLAFFVFTPFWHILRWWDFIVVIVFCFHHKIKTSCMCRQIIQSTLSTNVISVFIKVVTSTPFRPWYNMPLSVHILIFWNGLVLSAEVNSSMVGSVVLSHMPDFSPWCCSERYMFLFKMHW